MFFGVKNIFFVKSHRIFILIFSIRSNGDQMNALLLILHLISISTPPSMEYNSALVGCISSVGKNEVVQAASVH